MSGLLDFHDALLNPDQAVPKGLIDPQGRAAGKRFDVYRNNVVAGLSDALVAAFPVLCKLLGEEAFRSLAAIFVRQNPPQTPLMMFYGAELPGFLEAFEPLSHLGYLPDIARLEQAQRRAYHAKNATALDPAILQALPIEDLMASRLTLAPALQIIPSRWPILSIWQFNQPESGPKPKMRAEDVLITRPEFDPVLSLLPEGGAEFLAALNKGQTFGAALETTPHLVLSAMFSLLLSGGAITELSKEETP